jgi:acyl-CoA dehydrogenase
MTINLELPEKLTTRGEALHAFAENAFRPISRKYDRQEHDKPVELDQFAELVSANRDSAKGDKTEKPKKDGTVNGANLIGVLTAIEMAWGDVGLMLALPGRGLGNAAIDAVANEQQLEEYGSVYAAMAITEPGFGSDSAAVSTTATKDGDDYIINGEKIFVTDGSRCSHIVVWATLDKSQGRAAIKSFVVPRDAEGVTVVRLEHKLGIKASDTAAIRFEDVRVPATALLGSPEIDTKKSFSGVMQTFDNTRPAVAGMAVGVARAALEELRKALEEAGIEIDYDTPVNNQTGAAAEFLRLEADYEASYLHALRAAWMADNKQPNSTEASMSKAKAGRTVTDVTTRAVELLGSLGYSEDLLVEKWARDSKILDIFEGTQQIQNLIIARRILGKPSSELK